ncbi:MAG: hypothetical protein AB7S74_09835 [Hyphomicrobium sp.]
MTATYDVYRGEIVAFIDGRWRQCRLIDGWCTIADWWKPNRHRGVCMVKDLGSDDPGLKELCWHPALWIGREITETHQLRQAEWLRFGRVASIGPFEPPWLVDAAPHDPVWKIIKDHDDLTDPATSSEADSPLR